MDLERAASELRPRGAYEAVDFGFRLVKPHYLQLVATAGLLIGPLALLLLLYFPDHLGWLSLAVWWMKPIWERPILFTLGRTFFEDRPSIGQALRTFPRYGLRDLLPALSFRRLSPTRSFDLPVAVLEGATGRVRSERLGILHRGRFPSAAVALLFVLVNVEGALFVAMIVLFQLLTPEIVDWNVFDWAFGEGAAGDPAGPTSFGFFAYAGGLLAALLVGPFYVGAGFSLYLHRRTELEAWDLELAFRRLAERVRQGRREPPRGAAAAVVLALATALAGFAGVAPARADNSRSTAVEALLEARLETLAAERPALSVSEPEPGFDPEQARQAIQAILSGDAFHERETVRLPRLVLDWQLEADDDPGGALPEWLRGFAELISRVLGAGLEVVLVVAALAMLAAILVWVVWRRGGSLGADAIPRRAPKRPLELFGLELGEERLPSDWVGEARARATAGDARAALALLYRGALSRLVFVYGAELSKGVTEGECLEIARALLPREGLEYLHGLTRTWLTCAYGHADPGHERIDRLCEGWPSCFEPRSITIGSSDGGTAGVD